MNLQPRQLDTPEINLTALIDVIFLILVFLLISATFTRPSALEVNLPSAAPNSTMQSNDIVVQINQAGIIQIDEVLIERPTAAQVEAALTQALARQSNEEARIVIQADGDSAHRLVSRVLVSASALGVRDVAIATQAQP